MPTKTMPFPRAQSDAAAAAPAAGTPQPPRLEWINCLAGVRGNIEFFPAEISAPGDAPGVIFRLAADGALEISADFRAGEIFLAGTPLAAPRKLEPGVPALLRMGSRLLALCAFGGNAAGEDWAELYRFPLWTLFEPETYEAIETVRDAAEIPEALRRNGVPAEECLVSPYGLPVCAPLPQIADLLFRGNAPAAAA